MRTAVARYRSFFAAPRVGRVVAASLVGRLADAIIPYALLLSLAPQRGFGFAGAVSGAYALASAVTSPVRGRLVDRAGARPVLAACGVLQPVALLVLAAAIAGGAGSGAVVGLAIAAAVAAPPVAPVVRRIWTSMLADERTRETAYAFESVGGEAIFILGTILAGSLATLGVTSLIVAATCRAVGVLALAAQRPVRSLATTREERHWLGPLASAPFRALLAVVACNFAAFGALDVGVAAFAREAGAAALTGILLGVFGGGSIVGGVVQGGRDWRAPLTRQQSGWLAAMTAGFVAVALAPGVAALAVLLAIAGLAVAPAATVQMTLGMRLAPTGVETEALAWIASLGSFGFALGNAAGGRAVQDLAPSAALAAAAAFAALATILSLAGRDRTLGTAGRRNHGAEAGEGAPAA